MESKERERPKANIIQHEMAFPRELVCLLLGRHRSVYETLQKPWAPQDTIFVYFNDVLHQDTLQLVVKISVYRLFSKFDNIKVDITKLSFVAISYRQHKSQS